MIINISHIIGCYLHIVTDGVMSASDGQFLHKKHGKKHMNSILILRKKLLQMNNFPILFIIHYFILNSGNYQTIFVLKDN